MKQWQPQFPVKLLCRALAVSRCTFYARLKRSPYRRALENDRLRVQIRAAHTRTRRTYSAKHLQNELAADGMVASRDRIARLRREEGILCIQKRKFKATTNSNHSLPLVDNLLNQAFKPSKPNQVWVSDITCISIDEGCLYLAGIKDVFTCEIVGYAMGSRMTQELVRQALWKAWLNNSDVWPPCRGGATATTTHRWKASGAV